MGGSARRAAATVLFLGLAASHNAEAKWSISPDIALRETYTDNVFITGSTRASDLVTQITPGIRIEGSGARFKGALRYAPSAIFYSRNSQFDRIANNLQGLGTLEALERFLFVDASAAISQGFISPTSPQPADQTTITSNRLETRTASLSPYVRSQFGRL